MGYYKDVYLKSDEWKSLRAEAMAFGHYKCAVCKRDNIPLEAHHLQYRNLHDVRHRDLRVVCGDCHDDIHGLFERFPKLKTLEPKKQWAVVLYHLTDRKHFARREPPPSNYRQALEARRKRRFRFKSINRFRFCRDVLASMRLAKRKRMIWKEDMAFVVLPRRISPIEYLQHYIQITGIDPRYRADRIGPHKLLTFRRT